MSVDIQDLITLTDCARELKTGRKAIYRWLQEGIAPKHETIAGTHFFYRSALKDFKPPARGRKRVSNAKGPG